MAKIEERELEGHRDQIIADVKKLVEKYRRDIRLGRTGHRPSRRG